MNDIKAIIYRLLKLFPVAIIKENFETRSKVQNDILTEISEYYSSQKVFDFITSNLNYSKQHIYLFHNPMEFSKAMQYDFLSASRILRDSVDGKNIDYLFVDQVYDIITDSTNGIEKLELRFKQPLMIEISSNFIILKLTILERNPSSYLSDYDVIKYKRRLDDNELVDSFKEHFLMKFNTTLNHVDINKGIKYLWNSNMIDAVFVKYKREKSISTEVMDESYTFKQQYPIQFNEVLQSPLKKHGFRFLTDHDVYCDFSADPSNGTVSIHKYPTNKNQIENVIREIIRNN